MDWGLVQEQALDLLDEGLPLDQIEALLDPDALQDDSQDDFQGYLGCNPDQSVTDCINDGIAQVIQYQGNPPAPAAGAPAEPPAPQPGVVTGEPAPAAPETAGNEQPEPATAPIAALTPTEPSPEAAAPPPTPACDEVAQAFVERNFDILATTPAPEAAVPAECQPAVAALQSKSLGSDWDEIERLSRYFQGAQLPPGPVGDGGQ